MSESIPQGAVPLPATEFPYRAAVIASIQRNVDHWNEQAALHYKTACDNWLLNNTQRRDLGLALTEQPISPLAQELRAVEDERGTVWVWTASGDPLGAPCPKLPPLPEKPPEGNIAIGVHIHGAFYQCPREDTMPPGSTVVVPPAAGPEPGTYRKHVTPFGALWERIS